MRTSSAGRQRQLAREALAQLAEKDNLDPDAKEEAHSEEEAKMEESIRLWQQRMGAVVVVLRSTGAKCVLDLGCGEGKLLRLLLEEKELTEIGCIATIAWLDMTRLPSWK